MNDNFELSIKISSDISDAIDGFKTLRGAATNTINAMSSGFIKLGMRMKQVGQEIENVGKQFTKFGKDLVRNITLPLTALAGLSLKKVFDEAIGGRGTAAMNEFAGAVQSLKSNFDSLLKDLGQRLAPVFTPMIDLLNKAIKGWMGLSDSTKNIIITIGAVLAAIGPIIVAFGSFLVVLGKLTVAGGALALGWGKFLAFLKPIATALSAANILIAAVVVTIAGLINVFIKLKSAGVGTFEALAETANWFAAQFGSVVGGNILKVVSMLLSGLGKVASFVSKDFGKAIQSASDFVGQLAKDADDFANQASKSINDKLAKVGTTAGEAFSFGLFGGIEKEADKKVIKFKLSPDVQKMMIETQDAINQVNAIVAQGNIEQENMEAEHQAKMSEIANGEQFASGIQAQIERQRQYLNQKYTLQTEEIQREREKALAIAAVEEDATQRSLAIAAAENKYKVDIAKAAIEQRKALEQAAFQGEEQLLQKRKETYDKYLGPAAQGLTDGLLDFASGVKTAGEAFDEFARNFLRQISQMIMQELILKSLRSSFGFSQGGEVKAATGGYITGAGTSTSDSIPARLSNGEYVIRAAAVKKFGVGFFDRLNSATGIGRKPNHFADGGMVTSAAQAPQVVIQNKGSDKQVQGQSYDPVTAVTTVILDDVSKNGSISKAFQATFGVKRGGFR